MSNKILNLVFKADTTGAKTSIEELAGKEGQPGGVSGLNLAMSKAQLAWAAYGTAAIMAGKEVSKQIEEYGRYVTEVENLGYSLSLTTEDASFLVAAMDRYNISNDTMVAVFRKLSSEGIDPTIDNLKDLLIEWENMAEGAEKGQFAMEMFGEQGIKQILPWWQKLTEAQRENFGVQEEGLVVTQEMVAQNYEFQMSIADLTDEWGNFKMEILGGVIPALTELLQLLSSPSANKAADFINTTFGWEGTPGTGISSQPSGVSSAAGGQQMAAAYGISTPTYVDTRPGRGERYATGGSFTVGGSGGSDSTAVGFMATPGETVTVGGGTNDMAKMLAEVRRLVDSVPIAIADAIERG